VKADDSARVHASMSFTHCVLRASLDQLKEHDVMVASSAASFSNGSGDGE